MAASATTTRTSRISVIFLHGRVAGPDGCCADGVTSQGMNGGGGGEVVYEGKGLGQGNVVRKRSYLESVM
jgi:hypothetical protein